LFNLTGKVFVCTGAACEITRALVEGLAEAGYVTGQALHVNGGMVMEP